MLKKQIKNLNSQISLKQSVKSTLQKELDSLKANSKDIIVSEHAMIRYLQRVYKLDLEKIEKEILTDDLKSKVKAS